MFLTVTDVWTAGDFYPWITFQKMSWDIDSPNADWSDAVATNRMTNGTADL